MSRRQSENNDLTKKEFGAYPYLPLNLALKVSDGVKELGGARAEVQKSVLAKHLGDSEKSGSFSQKITSAKCFGLIDGHGAYSLTDAAKRYYFPTHDTDKASALLDVFSTPAPFRELLRMFDGNTLPGRENLGNILHRQLGVPESWKDRVASFFSNSAQFVGVIDGQGFLRFRAAKHPGPIQEEKVARENVSVSFDALPPTKATTPKADEGMIVWTRPYKEKTIQVITPLEIDLETWQKLSLYINLLKPPEAK